jgi:hypothetical protein
MQIFVDMDGVLADFDAHYEALFGMRPDKTADDVDWRAVREAGDFYLHIPPMPDLPILWGFLEPLSPIVLTGVPRSVAEAPANKLAWSARHLGAEVEVRCCLSREKALHARPGDVLIDDWEKYRHLWEAAGGRWITHVSAEATVSELSLLLGPA